MFLRKKRGFTLIELLVVIAIIGILATIVLVSLNTARAKARDARRSSDMHQISLAMEMYYDSNTSSYTNPNAGADWNSNFSTTCTGTISKGSSVFMAALPTDPGTKTYYCSNGGDTDGNTYCAWVNKETDSTKYILSNEKGTKEVTTNITSTATCGQ